MRQKIKIFLKTLAAFFMISLLMVAMPVFAAETFFIKGTVEVPPTCQVTDTGGKVHTFPKESSEGGFLGICAIAAAKEQGLIDSFSFIDFGFGLFLDSINGVKTSDDWDLSWSIYHNGKLAPVGLADLAIENGDELLFLYSSYSTGEEFDKLLLHTSLSSGLSSSKSGGESNRRLGPIAHHNFNARKAIEYLAGRQLKDGSFGNPVFTDWAAIAFGAYNPEHEAAQDLKNYLINNPYPGESLGDPVLSFIRRAMALMALGVDPYFGTSVNYIEKIIEAFDGEQVGDPKLVNDDIFALLVLRKAGFEPSDRVVEKVTRFILQKQKEDGSWQGDVDMTAAAIQALSLIPDIQGTNDAITKAKVYLQRQQQIDGGFGNPESTSWALQAIAALGEDWEKWEKGENDPESYLFHLQRMDGSLLSPQPVWSTAYAAVAAMGKPWGDVLRSFKKDERTFSLVRVTLFNRVEDILQELKSYVEILQASIGSFSF